MQRLLATEKSYTQAFYLLAASIVVLVEPQVDSVAKDFMCPALL
jgi:hypothetical protein